MTLRSRVLSLLRATAPAPPDGGALGAAVVGATFLVYGVAIGLEAVFGVLMAAILNEAASRDGAEGALQGVSLAGLAWVASISIFAELALGVPVGHACDRVGVRAVCALGGLLMGLGLWMSSFAARVEVLFFTYSVVVGAGLACAYGAASIGIGQYFTSRAASANMAAGVGMGAGTVALSFTIEALVARVGWRACLRVLGAVCASLVVAASLAFIPIAPPAAAPIEAGAEAQASKGEDGAGGKDERAGTAPAAVAAALPLSTVLPPLTAAAAAAGGEEAAAAAAAARPLRALPAATATAASANSAPPRQPLTALDMLRGERPAAPPPRGGSALAPLSTPQLRAASGGAASAGPSPRALPPLHARAARPDSEGESCALVVAGDGLAPGDGADVAGALAFIAAPASPRAGARATSTASSPRAAAAAATSSRATAAPARVATFRGGAADSPLMAGAGAGAAPPSSSSSVGLSPFLFAGSGSAASIVPALSLRAPALRELIRADGARAANAIRQRAASVSAASAANSAAAAGSGAPVAPATLAAALSAIHAVSAAAAAAAAADPDAGADSPAAALAVVARTLTGLHVARSASGAGIDVSGAGSGAGSGSGSRSGLASVDVSLHGGAEFLVGGPSAPESLPAPPSATFEGGAGATGASAAPAVSAASAEALSRAILSGGAKLAAETEAAFVERAAAEAMAELEGTDLATPPSGCCGATLHRLGLLPPLKHRQGHALNVWTEARFWAFAATMALSVASMCVSESYLGVYAQAEGGHSDSDVALIYSVLGLSGIVGRIAVGSVTLLWDVDLLFLVQLCGVVTGVAMCGLALYGKSLAYLLLFAAIQGAVGSCMFSFSSPILASLFGIAQLPFSLGGTYTVRAPLVLLAAPLAGYARDAGGSFQNVWAISGLILVLSALPVGLMRCECRWRGWR